jgi:hypothetical protein
VPAVTQGLLFPEEELSPPRDESSSTFVDNMRLPVHRWFRYSAGFSAQWAQAVIAEARGSGSITVLDPFVGAGTTLLAAEHLGVPSFGIDPHPFVARVARAKLQGAGVGNRLPGHGPGGDQTGDTTGVRAGVQLRGGGTR